MALSYRRLIQLALAGEIDDPASALADLDAKWQELGQGWVNPADTPLRMDDWLPPGELAESFHVDAQSFRHWARRGHIRILMTRQDGGSTVSAMWCSI